ncbi:unnamed protein product [Ixodes persulcatus]
MVRLVHFQELLAGACEALPADASSLQLQRCGSTSLAGGGDRPDPVRRRRTLESEDSSYDSDTENAPPEASSGGGRQHEDVSRTVSETLGAEFAEYVSSAGPHYASKLEFAVKLGYTEAQVQQALRRLGPQPGQNELLAELVRLGSREPLSAPSETAPDRGARAAQQEDALRPIVIDGSNVAMSHGNKELFSCRGIQLAVDWFRARGHTDISVFVPSWRKEASRADTPIRDQEILLQLEKERLLFFTPSRNVGGKRMVCYEDRYILKMAAQTDGVVVSNDNYRDLVAESVDFKRVVEERLLMYTFVNDRFMPPDDPLGRHGPSLDLFLRKGRSLPCPRPLAPCVGAEGAPPACPYGKKCTYGNKCKYYHPERGNLPQKSVTERLAEQARLQLQEVKARGGINSRDSSPGARQYRKSTAGTCMQQCSEDFRRRCNARSWKAGPVPVPCRMCMARQPTKRLYTRNVPSGELLKTKSLPPCSGEVPKKKAPLSRTKSSVPTASSLLPQDLLEVDGGGHLSVAKRLSDPDSGMASYSLSKGPVLGGGAGGGGPEETLGSNLHRKLQRQLTLNPSCDPRLYHLRMASGQQPHLLSAPTDTGPIHRKYERTSPRLVLRRAGSQENLQHRALGRLSSDSGLFGAAQGGGAWGLGAPLASSHPHPEVTRIASAPDSTRQRSQLRMQRLCSSSDTRKRFLSEGVSPTHPILGQLHRGVFLQYSRLSLIQTLLIQTHVQVPSYASLWEKTPDNSNFALFKQSAVSQLAYPAYPAPPGPGWLGLPLAPPPCEVPAEAGPRYRLYYHLSSIFPEEQVRAAMDLYPEETNPQKVCAAILTMFPKG